MFSEGKTLTVLNMWPLFLWHTPPLSSPPPSTSLCTSFLHSSFTFDLHHMSSPFHVSYFSIQLLIYFTCFQFLILSTLILPLVLFNIQFTVTVAQKVRIKYIDDCDNVIYSWLIKCLSSQIVIDQSPPPLTFADCVFRLKHIDWGLCFNFSTLVEHYRANSENDVDLLHIDLK